MNSTAPTIRRAVPADARLLAEHRAAVWLEVGDWEWSRLAPQIEPWAAFFRAHLADETYVAFVADDAAGNPLGSGAVLVHLAIPRPGSDSDRTGRVQSVYVLPVARRAGVARAIMERILAYAREARLIALALHPSDEARGLYTALAFSAADEMVLHLA